MEEEIENLEMDRTPRVQDQNHEAYSPVSQVTLRTDRIP